jgi:hypothetical protein
MNVNSGFTLPAGVRHLSQQELKQKAKELNENIKKNGIPQDVKQKYGIK